MYPSNRDSKYAVLHLSSEIELILEEKFKYINSENTRDPGDAQSMIKDLFASTVQEMLDAEMDTHLGYAKDATKHKDTTVTGISRNASSPLNSEI